MEKRSKNLADIEKFASMVCKKNGWLINPDKEFTSIVERGLTQNFNRYSYFLCPCRDGSGDRKIDRDIICPCIYAKDDIAEYGQCFCAFYVSQDYINSNTELAQIPERRPEELW